MTRGLFELQQSARVTEQHLAVIGQRDTSGRAPEQRTFGLKLQSLHLLADVRLREIEPLGGTVEADMTRDRPTLVRCSSHDRDHCP